MITEARLDKIIEANNPHTVHADEISLHIAGEHGKLGRDLKYVAKQQGFNTTLPPQDADYVALCMPSDVASRLIETELFEGQKVIDLSGAAKRSNDDQYGLMRNPLCPWDRDFNPKAKLFSNPGCIASAAIMGLVKAGLTDIELPSEVAIFSVGGASHTKSIDKNNIRLARRLNNHPHIDEIEQAFDGGLKVRSFMPVASDVPTGLMVAISGKTIRHPNVNTGQPSLDVEEVIGTNSLRHRLEFADPISDDYEHVDFSLAVTIDNLRFVTANAVSLINFIHSNR